VIAASSNRGDLVLDPFCGCGTTIEASERLGRRWVGIDVSPKAVEILHKRFADLGWQEPTIVWHPSSPEAAEVLANIGTNDARKQFEAWVRRKIGAEKRRRKDRGIDGDATFKDRDGKLWNIVVSVKSGHQLPPAMMRDLCGVVERETKLKPTEEHLGVFVTMYPLGKEARLEASLRGHLTISDAEGDIPRVQIVTVDRLFTDLPAIRCPGENITPRPAPSLPALGEQVSMPFAQNDSGSRSPFSSGMPAKGTTRSGPSRPPPPASSPSMRRVVAKKK
jgi:site-specific DNA-methyltransferase (adenine-specific)